MYTERFSRDGHNLAEDLLPDCLCVLDSRSWDDLKRFGVPAERMTITHNPWLDTLASQSSAAAPAMPTEPRKQSMTVLLASQPLAEMQRVRNLYYNQYTIFECLLAAMQKLKGLQPEPVIQVLAHPSEEISRWENRLASKPYGNVKVQRLSDWRKQFGYVSQEAALFNGDILANLRLANPDASPAEIEHACRLAGAEDFIRDLPHGYATLVGDRGYSLSGGQRKRIAIARALIRKPSVLILDEATTSFEQSLEWSMLRALRAAMPDMTIIQVTHRLTMKEGADWVIALQGGKIIAEGDWISVQSRFSSLFQITNPQPR